MIKARVYEKQWGGSIMDYVRYFESAETIAEFRKETGFDVEVLDIPEVATKVVDFGERLAEKREADELESAKDYFLNEILPFLDHSEKVEMLAAIESGDEAKYHAITEPVIMRKVMREFNGNSGKIGGGDI